jgi:hypothetical protein
MSHQPLRKFRGSNDRCTEFCAAIAAEAVEKGCGGGGGGGCCCCGGGYTLVSSVFAISFHYSTYFVSIISISFHYSTYFSSVFSKYFHCSTWIS